MDIIRVALLLCWIGCNIVIIGLTLFGVQIKPAIIGRAKNVYLFSMLPGLIVISFSKLASVESSESNVVAMVLGQAIFIVMRYALIGLIVWKMYQTFYDCPFAKRILYVCVVLILLNIIEFVRISSGLFLIPIPGVLVIYGCLRDLLASGVILLPFQIEFAVLLYLLIFGGFNIFNKVKC